MDKMMEMDMDMEEVLTIVDSLSDFLKVPEATRVIVRRNNIEMLKWVQGFPDYKFKIEYFGEAIMSDSFNLAFYFFYTEQKAINMDRSQLGIYLTLAFHKS